MYVSNLEEYGHLLNGDNFNTDHLNNDMYMLFDNRLVSGEGIPLAVTCGCDYGVAVVTRWMDWLVGNYFCAGLGEEVPP